MALAIASPPRRREVAAVHRRGAYALITAAQVEMSRVALAK